VSVTIDLPPEVLAQVFQVPESEVPRLIRIELACALFARHALPHSQAASLAGLEREEMEQELGRRNIPRHYTQSDLSADLAYGSGQ
jgi:predicted HTH domain antitoxin